MSRVRPPDNIEIASLKKKQRTVFDPMTPGAGTPWEDRATHGVIGAFFKTCGMSLTAPGKLTKLIRRPETTTDARGFVIGASAIWGITALVHFAIFVWRDNKAAPAGSDFDTTATAVLGVLWLAAAGVGTFFLFKIYNIVYAKLTAQEKDSVLLPDVLLYNVNAYALGPSLLALIPFAGPPVALTWMFVDMIAVGNKRLRLPLAAAIIDALISLLVVFAIAGAVYFVGFYLILHRIMHYDPIVPPDVPLPVKS